MLPQNASTVQQVVQVELARTSSGPSAAELQRAFDRLLQGVIRGACIGLTLRGGLHLVGSLLSAVSKRKDRYSAGSLSVSLSRQQLYWAVQLVLMLLCVTGL